MRFADGNNSPGIDVPNCNSVYSKRGGVEITISTGTRNSQGSPYLGLVFFFLHPRVLIGLIIKVSYVIFIVARTVYIGLMISIGNTEFSSEHIMAFSSISVDSPIPERR